MKRLYTVILYCTLLAATTACCPCRLLTTSTQDSVRVETVVRTEFIPDTVFIDVPLERERQTVRDTTSHLETSFAVSDARINYDGTLSHSLENKPQQRPVPTEKEIIHRDSVRYRDRIVEKTVTVERELTWWQQTQMKGFWALAVITLLFMILRKLIPVIRKLI